MGTSAGALTGSLYCAGYTPSEVSRRRAGRTPHGPGLLQYYPDANLYPSLLC